MKKLNLIKSASFAALLSVIACSTDETSSFDLEDSQQSNLSSKSVELIIKGVEAENEQSNNPAKNAVDSDDDSRWSGYGNPLDFIVDLSSEQLVDYVNIAFFKGDNRKSSFVVYSSLNGSSWEKINTKNSSGKTDKLETFDLSNSVARYLKIEFLGNSDNDWNSVTDLEVYGTALTESEEDEENETEKIDVPEVNDGDDNDGDDNGSTGDNPEDILGSVIKDWKITYPVDEDGNDSSDADDCDDRNRDAHEQRDLTGNINSDYSDYFFVSGDEVVFKAHVGGATTSGSSYPRSEFRQLVGGDDNYWSMEDKQYLEVRVRATNLPKTKPEVSMVQIHGPEDEPLRVEYRSDKQGLHVVQNENTTKENVIDYELGQQLFVTVTVDNGNIALYILNEDTGETYEDDWDAEDNTGYFKVGCYTQSNNNLETCKPGEGYNNQDPDEYGEVRIKDLKLTETY